MYAFSSHHPQSTAGSVTVYGSDFFWSFASIFIWSVRWAEFGLITVNGELCLDNSDASDPINGLL